MKKAIALLLAASMIFSAAPAVFAAPVKIGISIWSSTDTLGSECKRMIDAAAKALGVETQWVDQAHISEQVTSSAETLALAGCDGIIICNSASAEMGSVIKTCDENEVYVAQFFRSIDKDTNPEEYKQAVESKYYVGAVHESEFDNGKTLVLILAGQKGCRKIGLEGWEPGDATFLGRWAGYKAGVEEWNAKHPDDKVVLLDPQYGRTTTDTGRATAEAIIDANPDIDALIVAGGGGDTLLGAMAAESGGHYADPFFAFLMVYNTVRGKYEPSTTGFHDMVFPYMYVASPEDYENYAKYFTGDQLPYNADEIKALADMSYEDLAAACAKLSVEDVVSRHAK